MGKVINNRTLAAGKLLDLPSPIILCVHRPDFDKAIAESGCQTLKLNLTLAKALSGKPVQDITAGITAEVIGLLPDGAAVYLSDYEMLFDPRYKVDVMKLFCEISRYKKLIVKWRGGFTNEALTYAEPGYADYAKYKISDYEIACVI
jgi:hypothetical protein